MKRTLRLHSEALTELTADELGGLAGAAEPLTERLSLSCPVAYCVLTILECVVGRTLRDCVIVPTNNCPTLLC